MKCPFCTKNMVVGSITQDRYALKWVPIDEDRGLLNFTPIVKGIKLTFMIKLKYFIASNAESLLLTG